MAEKKYRKRSIYILHYPNKRYVSYGLINELKKYKTIIHYCITEEGSSCGPKLSLETYKLMGVHYGDTNKYNYGTYNKYAINEMNKKYKNEMNLNNNNSIGDCINLRNNSVKFSKNYISHNEIGEEENVKEDINDLLGDLAIIGSLDKEMIETEQIEEPKKFIFIDECFHSKDEKFFILVVLAKYLKKIGTKAVIEKENEDIQINNTILQLICSGYILKQKYMFDFRLNPYRIKQFNDNKDEKDKFHNYLKL